MEWIADHVLFLVFWLVFFITIQIAGSGVRKPISVKSDGWAELDVPKRFLAWYATATLLTFLAGPIILIFFDGLRMLETNHDAKWSIVIVCLLLAIYALLLLWVFFDIVTQRIAFRDKQVRIKKYNFEKTLYWPDIDEIYMGSSPIVISAHNQKHRFFGHRRGGVQLAEAAIEQGVTVRVAWVKANTYPSSA